MADNVHSGIFGADAVNALHGTIKAFNAATERQTVNEL